MRHASIPIAPAVLESTSAECLFQGLVEKHPVNIWRHLNYFAGKFCILWFVLSVSYIGHGAQLLQSVKVGAPRVRASFGGSLPTQPEATKACLRRPFCLKNLEMLSPYTRYVICIFGNQSGSTFVFRTTSQP